MSPSGILTIARLELLQRLRGARWYVALAAWVLLVGSITLLTWWSMSGVDFAPGGTIFDVVLFFVLGFGMLIMPALTATSVNGDREHGVLATLQTTLLSPADIVLGKLLASFTICMAFLASAAPFLLVAILLGGVDLLGALRVVVVMAIILTTVCAIGLMFSTLVARPVGSAVLTYMTVAALSFLTTITFVMGLFLVDDEEQVTVYGTPPSASYDYSSTPSCERYTDTRQVVHTERVWWLLAFNPFVIVGDAAPAPTPTTRASDAFTPLRLISLGVRLAKAGPEEVVDECWGDVYEPDDGLQRAADEPPVWPYGLVLYVLAGIGATLVAIRRVRTPVKRLPSGTRIA